MPRSTRSSTTPTTPRRRCASAWRRSGGAAGESRGAGRFPQPAGDRSRRAWIELSIEPLMPVVDRALDRGRSTSPGAVGPDQPPIGARGLAPQNSCVPSMPMMCTETRLTTIDLAVATPTPTGPPLAVKP